MQYNGTMKQFFLFLGAAFLVFIMFGGSGLVVAAPETPPTSFFGGEIPAGPDSGKSFLGLVQNLTDWLFLIFMLAAVVFVIFAAFQFLMGGGDPSQVSSARSRFLWAVVAIGLAILAKTIPIVVQNIITASG